MIDTNLSSMEADLKEVANMFDGGAELSIRHRFEEKKEKIVNTITFCGKSYCFGNLIEENLSGIEKTRIVKRYAKLSLYKALSSYFNVNLPWGALTGIRPTKFAYQQIERTGEYKEFFADFMKVSKEKIDLTEKILETQKPVYEKNDDNCDFFIFIPFCPSRCKYCSFISADIKSAAKYVDDYVDALVEEIKESIPLVKKLRSIYIGGGTPVSLSNRNLEKVLCAVDKLNCGVEYTVEAGRPDSINKENLAILKAHNVTRISVNPQTFSNETLIKIGRNHTVEDILNKYELARKDFSVNMDLIAGLEGEDFSVFKNSLDRAIDLSPDNITVHTLCVKRGSYLSESVIRLKEEETPKMIDYTHLALQNAGYDPYYIYRQKNAAANLENCGYTKPNKLCVYNVDVMEEIAQNIACGANAISKRVYNSKEKIVRLAPPKDIVTYLNKVKEHTKAKIELFS